MSPSLRRVKIRDVMGFKDRRRSPWFVLFGAILVYVTVSGTFFYAFGVFLPVMTGELGWSRSAISGGLTLSLLIYGFASPLIGISVNRFGARANIIAGNLLAAVGLLATSQCRELWQFYIFFGVMVGLGTAFGQYLACTTLANSWFTDKKGLAIGLLVAGGGIAGFVFPPLASWLIETLSWRAAWIVFGGLNLILAVIIGGVLIVRDRPAGMALPAVDGTPARTPPSAASAEAVTPVTLRRLAGRPAFWCIIVIGAANLFALGSINAHQVAYLIDTGFTAILAAAVYGLISVMNAVGRVGLGALVLRFNLRRLVVLAFLLQIAAFTTLLTARAPGLIYLYSILFGISCGAVWVSIPVLVAEYFGSWRFAVVLGWVLPICIVTESVGTVVTGAIYDLNGSYTPAFLVMLILSGIGLTATLWLDRLRPQASA